MKGIAILCIAIHNLVHLQSFGFVAENEVSYSPERYKLFMDHLLNLDSKLPGDIFSFLGWLGVPVFVFISGYGLAKKYDHQRTLEAYGYLKYSYLKLMLLMLPAVTYLLFKDILQFNDYGIATKIFSLSFLTNLFSFIVPYPVVVYWYFGLTMELYILYLVFHKWQSPRLLLWTGVICLLIQVSLYFVDGNSRILHYFKDNFIGWLFVFNMGIYYARNSLSDNIKMDWIKGSVLLLVSSILLILMNGNYFLWLLMPIMAVPVCLIISKAISHVTYLNAVFVWLGKYSACIFVVHPLIRMLDFSTLRNIHILICIAVYLTLTIITAYFYNIIYTGLKSKILK